MHARLGGFRLVGGGLRVAGPHAVPKGTNFLQYYPEMEAALQAKFDDFYTAFKPVQESLMGSNPTWFGFKGGAHRDIVRKSHPWIGQPLRHVTE